MARMQPLRRTRYALLLLMLAAAAPPGRAAGRGRDILFWAPYAAGSGEQAAATMEAFARYVERAAGWPAGSAAASYVNTVEGGRQAVASGPPGFLVVPVPIYLRYQAAYGWKPLRFVVTDGGDAERYSVFGPAGSSLASLAGATLEGETAYDAAFVAGVVFGKGADEIKLQLHATARTLSAVRRAAQGEAVAVLLNESQRKALDQLPAGTSLQRLAESAWMPAGILVGGPGTSAADAAALTRALDKARDDPSAAELLKTMKIRRFDPVASELLASLGRAFTKAEGAAGGAPVTRGNP
jgi:hypothetical protein